MRKAMREAGTRKALVPSVMQFPFSRIHTHTKKNKSTFAYATSSGSIMTNSSLIANNLKRLRVSSTLNKNVKEFNKDFMIDGNDETCWNSHQGSPQSILIEFNEPCIASQVHIMFQGGFVGKNCEFWVKKASSNEEDWIKCKSFYPVDNNSMQKFDTDCSEAIQALKIVFLDSSDFYGRITIYRLDVIGKIL